MCIAMCYCTILEKYYSQVKNKMGKVVGFIDIIIYENITVIFYFKVCFGLLHVKSKEKYYGQTRHFHKMLII